MAKKRKFSRSKFSQMIEAKTTITNKMPPIVFTRKTLRLYDEAYHKGHPDAPWTKIE